MAKTAELLAQAILLITFQKYATIYIHIDADFGADYDLSQRNGPMKITV